MISQRICKISAPAPPKPFTATYYETHMPQRASVAKMSSNVQNGKPSRILPLLNPFFSWKKVKLLYVACMVCEVNVMRGKSFIFCECFFLLHPTPIPFLIGFQMDFTLAFNIIIRESNNNHLTITEWNATFHLILQYRLWFDIKPLNIDPQPDKTGPLSSIWHCMPTTPNM